MAKFKLPAIGFNEGSLLRRTLIHVLTFVVGSVGFVALASLIVVSAAKSLLPSRGAPAAASAESDKPAEVAAVTPGKTNGKIPRPKRGKPSAATAEEAPVEEAH